MQTSDRSNSTEQFADRPPANGQALPCSPQDLKAMEALFENLDPESVECDLLQPAEPAINPLEWDLVDLIA